jgi:hypothetical protein
MSNLCAKLSLRWLRPRALYKGSKQILSEFLPLFLQKESGFQGEALRISTGEKDICTLFTDERFQKVVGLGNARL